LQDASTGEVQYANVTPDIDTFEAVQNATGTTVIGAGAPGGFIADIIYDTNTVASPDFTLNVGNGEITCNTAGDYIITMTTAMNALNSGTIGIFVHGLLVNGVVAGATLMSHTQVANSESVTITRQVTLAASQIIQGAVQKAFGSISIENIGIINTINIVKV
jgi:hypothetical protein